jgi:hypothetical protein
MKHPYLVYLKTFAYPSTNDRHQILMELCISCGASKFNTETGSPARPTRIIEKLTVKLDVQQLIGVGGFHRSHQALYLDDYFYQNPGSDWGICGVGLLDNDYDRRMRDALQSQDCLYTLVERSPERDRARIIG